MTLKLPYQEDIDDMVVHAPTEVAYLMCTCRNLGTLQHTLCSGKMSMGRKIVPSLKYREGYVRLGF